MHASDTIQEVEMSGKIATEGAILAAQQPEIVEIIEDKRAIGKTVGGVETITRTEDVVTKKTNGIETSHRVVIGEVHRRSSRRPESLSKHMISPAASHNKKRRAAGLCQIISTWSLISRTVNCSICRDLNEASRHQAPLHPSPPNRPLLAPAKKIVTINVRDDHHHLREGDRIGGGADRLLQEDNRIGVGADQGTAANVDKKKSKKRKKRKWKKKL